MRVRVVTDSSTNVPDSYLSRLGIVETPAIVNFGTRSFRNKIDLSIEEFYRRLATADRLPTTAQPTPQQFADAYAQLAAEGAEEVIAVCVSGQMSGTLNSAVLAAEQAPVVVHPWDSQSASIGAGWQAIAAAEMARAGLDSASILDRLAGIRARIQTITTPATLRYLVASGRAPRLQGSIGDLLDIKPLLSMVNGLLEPVGQARGRRRALAEMIHRIAAVVGERPVRVGLAHANVLEEATKFLEDVRARLNTIETFITDIGPVLTTLAGPGLIALAAYTVEENHS
jgi:DegV family protein with EDD domain